ncbi:MAG TPA: ribonuclease III [Anaeromyxobacteraceae bacterium]|nr:ribonuclease III [Anaeromyxobacteraceae bacterium]
MGTVEGEGQDVPVAPEPDRVKELEGRLGLAFAESARALSALTHKSYVNEHRDEAAEDNERLEFLGDAVVDLIVSNRLMQRFPGAREGDLSKMRAAVVDEAGLAAMARSLGLGALLRLGRGEELTGGRDKPSLLADAMEAVIAAVFLERGLPGAEAIVERSLEEAYARAAAGTLDRDYKTQMQEICQGRFRVSPRYRVVAEHGPDHHKTFEVAVELRGEVLGTGSGRSKKDAEQLAARQALDVLQASPAAPGAHAEEGAVPAALPAALPGPAGPAPEPVVEAVAVEVPAARPAGRKARGVARPKKGAGRRKATGGAKAPKGKKKARPRGKPGTRR